jgi:uncharacterized protein YdhG (YjbR/CyaY superfamily)
MANIQYGSVDDYIAAQAKPVQTALKRVRDAVRRAVPRADESISYNMPAYKLDGKSLLLFAGWKTHYALYAASASIFKQFRTELSRYEIEKGTIRFPIGEPVPEKLIERIAEFRASELSKEHAISN